MQAAIGKAKADISTDGEKRTRHMAMSDRTMISNLKMILRLKKDRAESGDPAPEQVSERVSDGTRAASEPAQSTQADPVSGVATGVQNAAQTNPVTTQVVDGVSDNHAPAAAAAALSAIGSPPSAGGGRNPVPTPPPALIPAAAAEADVDPLEGLIGEELKEFANLRPAQPLE